MGKIVEDAIKLSTGENKAVIRIPYIFTATNIIDYAIDVIGKGVHVLMLRKERDQNIWEFTSLESSIYGTNNLKTYSLRVHEKVNNLRVLDSRTLLLQGLNAARIIDVEGNIVAEIDTQRAKDCSITAGIYNYYVFINRGLRGKQLLVIDKAKGRVVDEVKSVEWVKWVRDATGLTLVVKSKARLRVYIENYTLSKTRTYDVEFKGVNLKPKTLKLIHGFGVVSTSNETTLLSLYGVEKIPATTNMITPLKCSAELDPCIAATYRDDLVLIYGAEAMRIQRLPLKLNNYVILRNISYTDQLHLIPTLPLQSAKIVTVSSNFEQDVKLPEELNIKYIELRDNKTIISLPNSIKIITARRIAYDLLPLLATVGENALSIICLTGAREIIVKRDDRKPNTLYIISHDIDDIDVTPSNGSTKSGKNSLIVSLDPRDYPQTLLHLRIGVEPKVHATLLIEHSPPNILVEDAMNMNVRINVFMGNQLIKSVSRSYLIVSLKHLNTYGDGHGKIIVEDEWGNIVTVDVNNIVVIEDFNANYISVKYAVKDGNIVNDYLIRVKKKILNINTIIDVNPFVRGETSICLPIRLEYEHNVNDLELELSPNTLCYNVTSNQGEDVYIKIKIANMLSRLLLLSGDDVAKAVRRILARVIPIDADVRRSRLVLRVAEGGYIVVRGVSESNVHYVKEGQLIEFKDPYVEILDRNSVYRFKQLSLTPVIRITTFRGLASITSTSPTLFLSCWGLGLGLKLDIPVSKLLEDLSLCRYIRLVVLAPGYTLKTCIDLFKELLASAIVTANVLKMILEKRKLF